MTTHQDRDIEPNPDATSDAENNDDTDEEENEKPCRMCTSLWDRCHKKMFSMYCIDAVDYAFCQDPVGMSRKKINMVFTSAYNRTMDFRMFQETTKLLAHGFYYPPACLKSELDSFMIELEKDQSNCINRVTTFQPEVEVNNYEDIESQTQSNCSLQFSLDLCEDCGKTRYQCHQQLFGDYCYAHMMRYYDLYPIKKTHDVAKKVFLKKYNSALHFFMWEATSNYLRPFFILPPRCLERQLEGDLRILLKKRNEYMKKEKVKTTDSIDFNLNFEGMEIEY